ncbi:hypothetical protein V8C35DRAFT_287877 [Trichoderma chlorosporum]
MVLVIASMFHSLFFTTSTFWRIGSSEHCVKWLRCVMRRWARGMRGYLLTARLMPNVRSRVGWPLFFFLNTHFFNFSHSSGFFFGGVRAILHKGAMRACATWCCSKAVSEWLANCGKVKGQGDDKMEKGTKKRVLFGLVRFWELVGGLVFCFRRDVRSTGSQGQRRVSCSSSSSFDEMSILLYCLW